MRGEPIVALNQGLQFLKSDLENEPRTVESVWISVISFGGQARVEVPLTELLGFIPPTLKGDTGGEFTGLGKALRLLSLAIDRDVKLRTEESPGDFCPIAIIFLDGDPSDDWREAAHDLKQRKHIKLANIIGIGCGADVNTTALREITENVLLMENLSAGAFQNLICWIDQDSP
jgi:uncharacterized protein YegL